MVSPSLNSVICVLHLQKAHLTRRDVKKMNPYTSERSQVLQTDSNGRAAPVGEMCHLLPLAAISANQDGWHTCHQGCDWWRHIVIMDVIGGMLQGL